MQIDGRSVCICLVVDKAPSVCGSINEIDDAVHNCRLTVALGADPKWRLLVPIDGQPCFLPERPFSDCLNGIDRHIDDSPQLRLLRSRMRDRIAARYLSRFSPNSLELSNRATACQS